MKWDYSLAVALFTATATGEVDYSQYVNPFIGGAGPFEDLAFGGGQIFVGGSTPFGSVKVGIDTYEENVTFSQINGGWTPKGLVTGVSMLHVSGTGGSPKYGLIPQMPLTTITPPVNLLDNSTYWQRRVDEVASVGYYKTTLENDVLIELSATHNAGIMQYRFPEGQKHILVDISHYIPNELGGYAVQTFEGGEIHLHRSTYTGYGVYGGGWNEGAPFPVYFCGEFDYPPDQSRVIQGPNTDPMARLHGLSSEDIPMATFGDAGTARSGWMNDRIGAVFTWSDTSPRSIKSKVGISFVSVDNACRYKDQEISSWNLDNTVSAAVTKWNDNVFSKVRVSTEGPSVNKTNLILLYSSLYFMHLMPVDRTGENPFWTSKEPYWDDFYTLWDLFKCTMSLYHLIQPTAYEAMIRSLIDTWRHEGYMPDGRAGFWNGQVQGGSSADNVLADAYVKGLRGDINWTAGYLAMLKNAEIMPVNTFSYDDKTASVKEGRGALDDWLKVGYVSSNSTRCISRTADYSLNDYAVSVVARGESPNDARKYLARSAGWQKIWNMDVESRSFQGFLAPKTIEGEWDLTNYDVLQCGGIDCGFLGHSFQTVPFECSFDLPMDVESVIQKMGGAAEFERRLDYIFLPNTSAEDLGVNGAAITSIMNIGNEPDFAFPYLYNHLNKQFKSVNQTRALANQYFKNELYGIPGNSDAGALNSWLIWSMVGLYPIVTQTTYLLGSPWFEDINITVHENSNLRIQSNGNSQSLGQDGFYVRRVQVNGQDWHKNWLQHEDVMMNGGTIEFEVGDEPLQWEDGDKPPSPGHYELGLEEQDSERGTPYVDGSTIFRLATKVVEQLRLVGSSLALRFGL